MFNPQQKPGDELRTINGFICYLTNLSTNQGWFWSCNKRHFSSVIHRYSEQPNERRHHSSWSGVSGATPVTCVTSSLRDGLHLLGPFSICRASPNWVHPRFICDLSSPQARNVSPSPAMAWHGMAWSAASFFRKCLPGESERARAKSEGRMNHRSLVKWYPFWRSRPEGLLWSHVPHGVSRNVWKFIVRSKCEWNVQISIRRSPWSEKYAIHAKKGLFSWAKIHLMAL